MSLPKSMLHSVLNALTRYRYSHSGACLLFSFVVIAWSSPPPTYTHTHSLNAMLTHIQEEPQACHILRAAHRAYEQRNKQAKQMGRQRGKIAEY